ncbi:hypothetical protein [Methylobacterium currus]|uniref:hypothetical protein n=1 Tax=Methylobacterium currus TaxID=2051553 RepID=UPI000F4EDF55|nr:hypothetical protein [Methylobacterium currus]
MLFAGLPARAGSGIVGVNVTNPQWLDRASQDAIIQQLASSGVKYVRIPLIPSNDSDRDKSIDLIKRFNAAGIQINLNIYPVYRADVLPRPPYKKPIDLWPAYRYSSIDLERFKIFASYVLKEIDKKDIKLVAIEAGNEINWTQFNGDFQVPGLGRVIGLEELQNDARVIDIARGFQAYIGMLREMHAIRAALNVNRATPIISAGLTDFGPAGVSIGTGLDAVSPDATIAYLRTLGLDALVDGYGIHTYDITGVESADHAGLLMRRTFSFCGGEGGKPCWLTEWGVNTESETCPVRDERRATIVSNWRTFMRELHSKGKLLASFYYSWSIPGDKISLFQCSQLTKSGAIAIAPNAMD